MRPFTLKTKGHTEPVEHRSDCDRVHERGKQLIFGDQVYAMLFNESSLQCLRRSCRNAIRSGRHRWGSEWVSSGGGKQRFSHTDLGAENIDA